MKKWIKIAGSFVIVLLVLVCIAVSSFLIRGGAFRENEIVSPGECWSVQTNYGSAEDIDIDRGAGIAYLSALDRRGLVLGNAVEGTILKLDLDAPNASPTTALKSTPDGFRPHGISLFTDSEGTQHLFVINHQYGTEEKIEVFSKSPNDPLFSHVETFSDPLITHPNDLTAVGKRQFYIANDSGATNGIQRAGEMMFGLGLSPLVYFDGERFAVVERGLKSSGGINVNLGEGLLFVGETMGNAIRVYKLNNDNSIEQQIYTIELDSSVDNIDIDTAENIWIANHTNTLALVRHFGDESSPAPSQVQKIPHNGNDFGPTKTVLESTGEDFSAASVGVRYKDLLVMGSITEPIVRLCHLDKSNLVN